MMPESFFNQVLIFFTENIVASSKLQTSSFLIILSISLILKYTTELRFNFPKILRDDSFIYICHIKNSFINQVAFKIYYSLFHTKLPCLILLLFGIWPKLCLLVLILGYTSEYILIKKNHVILSSLLLIIMFFDHTFIDNANIFIFKDNIFTQKVLINTPSILFFKTLLLSIYLASGLRKLLRGFSSGRVIRDATKFSLTDHMHSIHLFNITEFIATKAIIPNAAIFAKLTIILQLTIPLLLVAGSWWTIYAVFIGIFLHLGMSLLMPLLLIPFSSIMIGLLLLWL